MTSSPLNEYAQQILEWIEAGKTQEQVAAIFINDYKLQTTQRSVSRIYNRLKASRKGERELAQAKENYAIDLKKANELLDELVRDAMAVDSKGMTLLQWNAFRAKLAAVREKLKVLGAYAPESLTQIAIQVNLKSAKEKLRAILDGTNS